jgi:hypothetical protein
MKILVEIFLVSVWDARLPELSFRAFALSADIEYSPYPIRTLGNLPEVPSLTSLLMDL